MRIFVICLLLFLSVPLIAQAHDDAETLTLQTIIQSAMENSSETARILAKTADVKAEAFEIETLENPELEANFTAIEHNATRGFEIELEQPLRLSHFGARGSYADALRRTASLEEKARILEVIHSITRTYAAFWGFQEQKHILRANVAYVKDKQKLIEDAAEQGRVDVSEALIFKAEALHLEEQLRRLASEKNQAGVALLRMAGMKQQNFLAEPPELPMVPSMTDIQKLAGTETNVRRILESRKIMAARRYAVARQDAGFPAFTPRAVLDRNFDENSTTLLLGFGINIPVWQRNNAELMRASAEKNLANRALQAMDDHNFTNVLAAAYERFRAAQTSAFAYSNSVLPEWEKVQALIDKKFDGGQASVLDLWQVRESIREVQEEGLEATLMAVDAQIELETLIGQTLSTPEEATP